MTDRDIANNLATVQEDLERITNNVRCGYGLTMEQVCDLSDFIQTQLTDIGDELEARGSLRMPARIEPMMSSWKVSRIVPGQASWTMRETAARQAGSPSR